MYRVTTAAAITAAVLFLGQGAAEATTRGDAWKARSSTAVTKFRAIDTGQETAFAYAYMAEASGRLYGWPHAWTTTYLNKVYSLANPDGGYGLGYADDAFDDGTVNPADTTYTVTLAGHVGPALLAGYKAGAVPKAKVQTIVDLLMSTPLVPGVDRGKCLAYSRNTNDAQLGYCVHNVNSGAAWFLQEAQAAGVGATGLHKLIVDITLHETAAYRPDTYWWPYLADGAPQDTDHNSYSAESMYRLTYPVGREAAYQHMNNPYADNPYSPIAHMRLTGLPGGPGSMGITNPATTLWCEMGDRWTSEFDAFVASPPPPAAMRYAQAAYYAARNWQAC